MSPTSYQAALPRVIPSLLSATLIIIPYSNGFVKRVRKVFLQQKQRMKTRLLTFFPESQQARQFTPLREGRRDAQAVRRLRTQFQFTPLREGRRTRSSASGRSAIFQFTPLREGRQDAVDAEKKALEISIHAPPRGATAGSRPQPARRGYFNSRPSARGDKKAADYGNKAINFNSRPSARGDEKIAKKCEKGLISIHAPPRGATKKAADYGNKAINFNSRPSARGDAL